MRLSLMFIDRHRRKRERRCARQIRHPITRTGRANWRRKARRRHARTPRTPRGACHGQPTVRTLRNSPGAMPKRPHHATAARISRHSYRSSPRNSCAVSVTHPPPHPKAPDQPRTPRCAATARRPLCPAPTPRALPKDGDTAPAPRTSAPRKNRGGAAHAQRFSRARTLAMCLIMAGRFSGNHSLGHCSSRHSWSAGAMPRRTRTSVSICSEMT